MSTVVGELTARVPVSIGATGATLDFTTIDGCGATTAAFGGGSGRGAGSDARSSAAATVSNGVTGSGGVTVVLAWTTRGAATGAFGGYSEVKVLRFVTNKVMPAIAPITASPMSIHGG